MSARWIWIALVAIAAIPETGHAATPRHEGEMARARLAAKSRRKARSNPVAVAARLAATTRTLDTIAAAVFPAREPGAVILVERHGRVLLRRGYGAAAPGSATIDPAAALPIGPIAEQLTAAAVLQLAETGRLALSDTLTRWLPAFPMTRGAITLEHLLTHTSGIAKAVSIPERPQDFVPGTAWRMNESDYQLLAGVVEKASGEHFDDYLRLRLLEPLGMTATRAEAATRAVHATVDDLAQWNRALSGRRIVDPTLLLRAFTPTVLPEGTSTQYGYGFWVGVLAGHGTLERGGPTSHLLRMPDQGLLVAILATREDRDLGRLALRLASAAIGEPWREPEPVVLAPEQLERVTGVYRAENVRHTVTREGARLFLRRNGGARREILPLSPTDFFVPGSDARLEFELGQDGRAVRVVARERYGPPESAERSDEPLPAGSP